MQEDREDSQGVLDRPEDVYWYREGRKSMIAEVLEMVEDEMARVQHGGHLSAIHRRLQETKEALDGERTV